MKLPLLPLNAIVCPKGRIPLQIFEPHYLDMVAETIKADTGFVVVLLHEGKKDTGEIHRDQFYRLGTLVKLVDFDKTQSTGVLNITVEGIRRVELTDLERRENGLWLAELTETESEDYVGLPEEFDELRTVLRALVKHPFVEGLNMEIDYSDGRQVSWRLTELLPLGNQQKQMLYETTDAITRLEKISSQISDLVN